MSRLTIPTPACICPRLAGSGRWLPLAIGPLAVCLASAGLPRWQQMWLLAGSMYAGCKWLTWCRAWRSAATAPAWRSWAYLLAWPGMDAAEFLDASVQPVRPAKSESLLAGANSLLGAVLLGFASSHAILVWPQVAAWLALLGLGLLLHCGLFHGLSIVWRRAGASLRPDHALPDSIYVRRRFLGPPLESRLPRVGQPLRLSSLRPTIFRPQWRWCCRSWCRG